MPTIGIISVTTPGSADCFNHLNRLASRHFSDHDQPAIILHQLNFGDTHRAQCVNRWDIVEDRLVASARLIASAGADFAIIPANTVHKVISGVQRRTIMPILNMLEIVAAACHQRGFSKVGVLGTQWTTGNHLYQAPLAAKGIEEIIPTTDDQDILQRAIYDEIIKTGTAKAKTIAKLQGVVSRLKQRGCDAVLLACTELPLVLNSENCGLPTLDTTAIIAEAAFNHALSLIPGQHKTRSLASVNSNRKVSS